VTDHAAREALAAALYRLEWDADLYATPRGGYTERYERRADRLLASPALDAVVAERGAALAEDVIARLGKYRTGLDSTIFVLQEHQLRAALRERSQSDE